MSFDISIPCNCQREGNINIPPFIDLLILENNIWCIKPEHDTKSLEKKYDDWFFCKHNQYALTLSMSQSIKSWKPYIKENYPNKFNNLVRFLPDNYNGYINTEYDKLKALNELQELMLLEDKKHSKRLSQFEQLLHTAIAFNQDIYWD